MNDTVDLQTDLETRMRPSETTLATVAAFFDANPAVTAVHTPIWFPAKKYGIWQADSQVADAAVLCGRRNDAYLHAAKALGEQPGTVGYVWHRPGEQWAVFEDILSPAEHLRFAQSRNRSR